MFSSSSNFNPFEYANHTSNFTGIDQNPSPTQEDQSPPFWYIPDRFLDNGDLLITEFLSQQQQEQEQQQQQQYEKQVLGSNATVGAAETQAIVNPAAGPDNAIGASTNNKKKRSNASNAPKQPTNPRRRTGKKDRHSKIHTAQGPRDRRMRLSLQIARKFFDLQDLLGFDKASKTIEWLFTKSKVAIKELTDSLPRGKRSSSSSACGKSPSSTSESEVVSGIVVISDTIEDKRRKEEKSDSLGSILKEKRSKRLHKPAFSPVDRESRDKARARARERAREKKQNKDIVENSKQSSQPNPSNLETLGCSGTQDMNSSAKEVYEKEESSSHLLQHQMDSANKFLGITSSPRSSSVFDFVPSGANFENEYSGFPLNWEMMTNGSVQHRYSTISNMKLSTGNLQVQNPNSFSMTLPNGLEQKTSSDFAIPSSQEQILRSMFMTTTLNSQEENPSSDFVNMSNPNMQNLNSILLATTTDNTGLHPHIIGNQFSSNPIVSADYVSFC